MKILEKLEKAVLIAENIEKAVDRMECHEDTIRVLNQECPELVPKFMRELETTKQAKQRLEERLKNLLKEML